MIGAELGAADLLLDGDQALPDFGRRGVHGDDWLTANHRGNSHSRKVSHSADYF